MELVLFFAMLPVSVFIIILFMFDRETVYVDMDGVLAKWNTEATLEDTLVPGYFLQREPEKSIIRCIKILRLLNVQVIILSAVCNEQAAMEKSAWLDRYLGRLQKRIFVPYGMNKADYISGGTGLLIDDYSPNLHMWEMSGNRGIKFRNGINGTKGTWKGDKISYDMSSIRMTYQILKKLP
jgi:hypothetical protein